MKTRSARDSEGYLNPCAINGPGGQFLQIRWWRGYGKFATRIVMANAIEDLHYRRWCVR